MEYEENMSHLLISMCHYYMYLVQSSYNSLVGRLWSGARSWVRTELADRYLRLWLVSV